MSYCVKCGQEAPEGAKFCPHCGAVMVSAATGSSHWGTPYEGEMHKCPNCGQPLESFMTNCPTCGYEIRGIKVVSSVKELSNKLEHIEAQRMPVIEENKSLLKMVFGADLNNPEKKRQAEERWAEEKKQEKVNLIINYPIPTTKEDIMEFMLLACSNINVKHGVDDDITKAWIAKLDQAYERAELSVNEGSDFERIKNIYTKKKMEIRKKKLHGILLVVCILAGIFFLGGLTTRPVMTIIITIAIIAAVIFIVKGIKNDSGKE